MKKIVFTRPDGGVTVRNLPPDAGVDDFNAAIENAKASGKAKSLPVVVDHTALPSYSERDKWAIKDGKVIVKK